MRVRCSAAAAMICVWALVLVACSGESSHDSPTATRTIPKVDESALPEPALDVGFIELEPVKYYAFAEPNPYLERRSIRSRLFYRLVPADEDAKNKPLLVFFNGGPRGTSMLLSSFGTGPTTLDIDAPDAAPMPNPNSFTRLGSLLYIDARGTGFSYDLSEDPQTAAQGAAELAVTTYNAAFDAADFVRTVLRVMDRQPALRNNRVVLVGESYGGFRAQLMLQHLLAPAEADGGEGILDDPELVAEIATHFQRVFGVEGPRASDPELRALQFGWQILIQPFLVSAFQPSGGVQPSPGDPDHSSSSSTSRMSTALRGAMTSLDSFATLVGSRAETIPGLAAGHRQGAFRCGAPSDESMDSDEWVENLGSLPTWDRYFLEVGGAFFSSDYRNNSRYSLEFLKGARFTQTLITNARRDGTVDSESIVPALRAQMSATPNAWLRAASFEGDAPDQVSERIVLEYADVPGVFSAATRRLWFPRYETSGHSVPVWAPKKFFDDASEFLRETGALEQP